MKIKRITIGLLIVTLSLIGAFLLFNNKKQVDIDSVLKKEAYSYLPEKAKEYVKEVYEKTGEVVLTEKNKVDNKPYLNPKFVNYLELSEKEKKKFELVPDTYVLEYQVDKSYGDVNLPSSYDLRNVNGKNFVTPQRNQGALGICWAMASVENVETFLLKSNDQSYSSSFKKLSVRQMDYATATDYLVKDASWTTCTSNCEYTAYDNLENGSRELGDGGNFFTSAIVMANAITLTPESVLPWNEYYRPLWAKNIMGISKASYEVDSAIILNTITEYNPSADILSNYVNKVKTYIMQYGGPWIGTLSPQSTCAFTNTDGTIAMKTDDCYDATANNYEGHAMQIIGWDDNYSYKYCDAGEYHYSVKNGTCTRGTLKQGTGAWIVRNSWGEDYKYIYLTQDSTNFQLGFVTSVSPIENRTWDNNYHDNPWINASINYGMSAVYSQTKEFKTNNIYPEKVEKVKFFTANSNAKYNLTIRSNGKNYINVATINTNEVGIYTFDLSDKNILVDDTFTVKIESPYGDGFWNDSISVFTSNTDDYPIVTLDVSGSATTYSPTETRPSATNPIYVTGNSTNTKVILDQHLKNLPENSPLQYTILLDGVYYNINLVNSTKSISLFDNVYTEMEFKPNDSNNYPFCGKTFTLEIESNHSLIARLPLKRICKRNGVDMITSSTIKYNKNDGSGYYSTVSKADLSEYTIMNADGTQNEDIGEEELFFRKDRYIKSWNTKADGTGTTYTNNNLYLFHDVDLYAQWSNPTTEPHQYNVLYRCTETGCTGENYGAYVSFDQEYALDSNHFTNDGKVFTHWTDGTNTFYEEEKYVNLVNGVSPYNLSDSITLYPVWASVYNTVTFNANGSNGTMGPIKVERNTDVRLKTNLFTKEGFEFIGWNTQADGNGTYYNDEQVVNISQDLTLYAIFDTEKAVVTFDSNGGSGNMNPQRVEFNTETALNRNLFSKEGYTFVSWNTKKDGTGTSYEDQGLITTSGDVTLYAQWQLNKYTVTFNAGTGSGEMNPQEIYHGVSTKLDKNLFTNGDTLFAGWNTQADGSGTSYYDEQEVVLTSNITLYAQWTSLPIIIFDANGGNGTMNPQEVPFNENVSINKNTFTRVDYLFDGWNTKKDGSGTKYNDEGIINTSTNVVLYAQWKAKPVINSIEVTGITAPVDTRVPSVEGISINTDGLSIKSVNWWKEISDSSYAAVSRFKLNTEYVLVIKLNVSDDYKLYKYIDEDDIITNEDYVRARYVDTYQELRIYFKATEVPPLPKPVVSVKGNNNKVTITVIEQEDAESYSYYRSTDKKKWTGFAGSNENTFVDEGLTYGKTYYYRVKTCNYNKKCSSYSDAVSIKVKPNKPVLNIVSAGTNNVKLEWSKVKVTGYQIARSTDNKNWTNIKTITKNSTLEYNNKSLKANKTYYYKIRAYKTVSGKKVYGSWSTVVSTKTAPNKPTFEVKLKDYNEMNLVIGYSKGTSEYRVYRSLDDKNWERIETLPKEGTLVDGDHEVGKMYYYKVKACNSLGNCSGYVYKELKQTVKTPKLTLESTTKKKVTITVGSVNMAEGYKVYRATSKNGKYELIKEITDPSELTFTNSTKSGYTYYYKVRAYSRVDGSKVYSPYSSIKSVKSK